MKGTRKHELQTNELADALGQAITWAKPHAKTIALVVAVVVVAVFVLVILPAVRGSASEMASAAFALAQNAGDTQSLRNFLEDYPEARQTPTARLLLADRLLREVVSKPKPTGDPLAEAGKLYAEIAESSELLRPLAKVGLALVTVQEGDLEKGREGLREVVSKWPQSIAAEKARAHIEALAGYKPLVFSNEPLEEPTEPEKGETEKAGPKEGEATKTPATHEGEGKKEPAAGKTGAAEAAHPETKTTETQPPPKGMGGEEKTEPKPVG